MRSLRAGLVLAAFLSMTLPLMPVQALLVRSGSRWARSFPHWYHRRVCWLLGIRVHLTGGIERGRPVLLVANHISWLDIPVLSALAPLSFIAKREVGTWPFVGQLAKLQRSIFIDRRQRGEVREQADSVATRLGQGEVVVLFPEGTTGDGNRLLPFKSALFAAVDRPYAAEEGAVLQTLALAYTHLHGMPLGRTKRPVIAWYGDMDVPGHAWEVLKSGPLDVHIRVSPPVDLTRFADRKALARYCEGRIRRDFTRLLRAHPDAGKPEAWEADPHDGGAGPGGTALDSSPAAR